MPLATVEQVHPRPLFYLSRTLQRLIAGKLWLQVLIALVAGLLVGILMGPDMGWMTEDTGKIIAAWLTLPGQIFLALIKMIVIPLVVASVIRALAGSESQEQLKRLGSRVALYYLMTTVMAVFIGIGAYSLIQPDRGLDLAMLQGIAPQNIEVEVTPAEPPTLESLPQRIVGILPTNPLHSMADGQMMHILVWAIISGIALLMLPAEQAKPLLTILGSVQAVSMTVVRWAMSLAPLAVFGFLAQLGMSLGLDVLTRLGVYVFTVLLGLLALFGVYMLILRLLLGESIRHFLRVARENLLLAFSTSSSAAIMPITVKTARSLNVRPSIAHFTIPMGTTINMDGTALYQIIAVLFLGGIFGVNLDWQDIILVMVLVTGASIGTPGTPGVGIAILAMTLETVGIPAAGIALILGVDRLLDMSRTTMNVTGDLVASLVMDRWVGSSMTHLQEAELEVAREQVRAATGEDVLINSRSE